jgi:hypothetical protein
MYPAGVRLVFYYVNDGKKGGFIEPTPGLERDYETAVDRLRQEKGDPKTLRERWRFWRSRRRLWRDLVARPRKSAHW